MLEHIFRLYTAAVAVNVKNIKNIIYCVTIISLLSRARLQKRQTTLKINSACISQFDTLCFAAPLLEQGGFCAIKEKQKRTEKLFSEIKMFYVLFYVLCLNGEFQWYFPTI